MTDVPDTTSPDLLDLLLDDPDPDVRAAIEETGLYLPTTPDITDW